MKIQLQVVLLQHEGEMKQWHIRLQLHQVENEIIITLHENPDV